MPRLSPCDGWRGDVTRPALIGRDHELAFLGENLAAAMRGEPRVVVCRGEPGIGKTRLAEALSENAKAKGMHHVWGRGAEAEGAPPYWPWQQVLRATADVVDLDTLAGQHGLTADVARLAPDVFGGAAPSLDPGSAEDRFRQFDAVARLLRHVALRTPLLIILDDVHSADQPSLLLLRHIARVLSDEKLLFLVNHRETDLHHAAVIADVVRERVAREMHLGGLGATAVAEQLAAAVGREVTDREAEEVRAFTRGNPFFIAEIGRALARSPSSGGTSLVTANVREAIGARLGRLSVDCVRVLRAASVVGRRFAIALVAEVLDLPVSKCLDPLDEATGAGLVDAGPIPGEYEFTHALVRDAIEAGLPTSERVGLHRAAAEATEKMHGGRLEPHLFDLARHWAVAAVQGDPTVGAGWIQRAAEEAMRGLAFEEAARLFRQALDVGGSHLNDVDRCRLLLGTGAALHAAADVNGRLEACLEAADIARGIGRSDLVGEAALLLEGVFGHPESDVTARRLCEEALSGLAGEQVALRARVSARLAEACMYINDVEAAEPASDDALSLAGECGDRGALVSALQARRLVREGPDGVEERERLADRMLALSSEQRDLDVEMSARLWRVDAFFERGDLVAVARELEALAPIAHEVGGPWAQWQLMRGQGVLAQAQARFADARRLATDAFNAIARTDNAFADLPRAGLVQAVGHHAGHDSDSLTAYGLGDGAAAAGSPQNQPLMLVLGPVHLLTEVGRLAEAATLYRSLGPATGWRPQAHGTIAAYSYGIGVAIALDVRSDVAVLRQLLDRYRGLHVASGAGAVAYFGPVELWLGVAAGHLGLLDESVVDLERAVHICAVNGAAGFHAEARYELASVLARRSGRDDHSRARLLVAEALREATELGMAPIAAKAAALVERLRAAEPAGALTRRELEVAQLVAEGLTSREISTRLYLSERTVQNHVQHILTKLNLSNRSQIAVWVTREMSTSAE